jgi:hypothetical protein
MPGRVVVGQGRNLELPIPLTIENHALTLLRHSLSQYRKYANQASCILRQPEKTESEASTS